MENLPKPFKRYTCGVTYENEMNDIPVTLSTSESSEECASGECGWFELLITPIKFLTRTDRPYLVDHDPDCAIVDLRRSDDGRFMILPATDLELCEIAPVNCIEDYYSQDENLILAYETLERIVSDGSHCDVKSYFAQQSQ